MEVLMTLRISKALALTFFTLLMTNANAQQSDSLRWSVTPYVWMPTTRVDLTFEDTTIGGTIRVKDVIDTIDSALMISVEGGKGQWSAFADLMFADASDVTERTLLSIRARNKQTFLDAALSFWPDGVDTPLSFIGGLRYTSFDNRFDIVSNPTGTTLLSTRSKADYYDVLLGLRYRFDLSDRWALLTRADTSFGDSDGTFMLRANFAYTVGKRGQNRILFGYQHKEADFEDGGLETAFEFSGFAAGFNFRF